MDVCAAVVEQVVMLTGTVVCRGGKNGNFPGLEGYTGVANIMGFPGRAGVFTVPTPITGMGMMKPAAKDKPSFLGYIAEGQGAVVQQYICHIKQQYICHIKQQLTPGVLHVARW